VRIGLQVAEAEERDGDYFGPQSTKQHALGVAHGGQLFLTAAVSASAASVPLMISSAVWRRRRWWLRA